MQNLNDNFIFGCWRINEWNYSPTETRRLIDQLLELGINEFDHADIYGNYSCETIFGKILADDQSLRAKIKLTSKCGIKLISDKFPEHKSHIYDTSKAHIIAAAERSIQNLQSGYLDLLLIHRPDPLMNADEVAEAFNQLKSSGKVINFGVSNFTPTQFELLQSRLNFALHTNQLEASVVCHEHFVNNNFDFCQKIKMRPQIWSPLAGGKLYDRANSAYLRVWHTLQQFAENHGTTPEVIAIAWLLAHPVKLRILLGSGKIERVKQLLQAQEIKLSRDEWFALWSAYTGVEIP
ncbi:MAG: aldo/keto reductase [Burkholderiales bacterium]|nr:aldo/keto reductase [Burkholderiales bacterium]